MAIFMCLCTLFIHIYVYMSIMCIKLYLLYSVHYNATLTILLALVLFNSMGTALLVVGFSCSLIGWIFVYAFICYVNAPRGYEWNCRLVTLFHGILIVLLTAYIAFIDGPWPFTHVGKIPVALHILTLHTFSMGLWVQTACVCAC